MNYNWKEDPRLRQMSRQKLDFLTDFAEKVEKTPRNQLLSAFLTLNMETSAKGVKFSDQETDLLVSILTAGMPEADRGKLDTLKMLSKKLSRKK